MDLQDPENQNYSNLKTLLLSDVAPLAPALLNGRFPALEEVRAVCDSDVGGRSYLFNSDTRRSWYRTDAETTRAWIDLIHSRQLQVFDIDEEIKFSPPDWEPGVGCKTLGRPAST